MSPQVTSLDEHWTIVDDRPMFYRASTDLAPPGATPIVHVHGFGISGRYLVPTAERLAHLHPTYVPDLPGYGRSISPDRALTIPELATALASFLDVIGISRVILLGNSMGCLISLEFARAFPDRIESAILVSPAGGPHNQPLYRGLSQLARDSVKEPVRLLPVAAPDYIRFGAANSLRLFHAMTTYPTVDIAMQLDLPILVVAGANDPLVSHENLQLLVENKPNMTFVILDGGAHALNFSHPERLAAIFESWTEQQSIGPKIDLAREIQVFESEVLGESEELDNAAVDTDL